MTTEELEEILDGGIETQRIEFKESCVWNVKHLAKDILAMTNVQGGGLIIIGIKEKGEAYERQGINAAHKASYVLDIMRDQVGNYADPYVEFSLEFPIDKDGKEFIVISVLPFKEIPVICKKDGPDTKIGCVYYRNRDGRVKSASVSNSYDMREIIDRAAIKLMQRQKSVGWIVPEPNDLLIKAMKRRLEKERGNL